MSASNFVQLRSGTIVPVSAVVLALDLEARGCFLRSEGDDLIVGPRERLDADDIRNLKRYKLHVLRILGEAEHVQ